MLNVRRRKPPLPTFVIVGAQKSGTRWLRWNLSKHRSVYAADAEANFFNNRDNYSQGSDWYRAQFPGWAGEPIVGEATPGYMMLRHRPDVVAARMHETIPNARLLAILRNPVDRAESAMVHYIKYERVAADADLVELVQSVPPERDPLGLIAGGFYATSLEPFRELFGDQLLVLFHDDALQDPHRLYARALEHIGASGGTAPRDLDDIVWSNATRRTDRRLTAEDRAELLSYFETEIDGLEQLTGRNLDMWRSGPSGRTDLRRSP
jgi:hypothetical protein